MPARSPGPRAPVREYQRPNAKKGGTHINLLITSYHKDLLDKYADLTYSTISATMRHAMDIALPQMLDEIGKGQFIEMSRTDGIHKISFIASERQARYLDEYGKLAMATSSSVIRAVIERALPLLIERAKEERGIS